MTAWDSLITSSCESGSEIDISGSDIDDDDITDESDHEKVADIFQAEPLDQVSSMEASVTAPMYVLPSSNECFVSPVTVEDIRSNLSDTALNDLVKLIGLHIPDNNILDENIDNLKLKCGFNKDTVKFYAFCNICENIFAGGIEQCQTPGCVGEKQDRKPNCYFATSKISSEKFY